MGLLGKLNLCVVAGAVTALSTAFAPASAATLQTQVLRTQAFANAVARRVPDFRSPSDRGLATDYAQVRGMRDMGRLPANRPVQIGLVMRFQHEAELKNLTFQQGEKRSPYYRHFLSNAQWNSYFAPDPATYQHAAFMLQRAGFRVNKTYTNRGMIIATAASSSVERYFKTQMHAMMQPGKGIRYANMTPAVMPDELKEVAVAVTGLQNLQTLHTPTMMLHQVRSALALRRLGENIGRSISLNHRQDVPTAPPSPAPVGTSTPAANPHPDPTESPNGVLDDYTAALGGYGPPTFAIAYDYPVQHGYGGTGHATGTVIDSDNSDKDMSLEFGNFNIPHTGVEHRVCTDPNNQCTICILTPTSTANTDATCDSEGESTLDAEALLTLAPDADLYEYLVNHTTSLIDLNIAGAYERAVADNVVDAVNSSFGGCETDDPTFEYIADHIAEEGAAKGITFSASTGDTGGYNCGVYVTNGAPQTLPNSSSPSSAYYFTAVGGTSFDPISPTSTTFYTAEQAWLDGGGGYSVLEPLPAYQAAVQTTTNVASVSTVGRNTPDLSLTADGGPAFIGGTQGAGLIIFNGGTESGSGGTSLSSPMWVAMQVDINHAVGSRNGWIVPRLYEIGANAAAYAACFRDITVGTNLRYTAVTGYDMTTGLGSPKGWEIAGNE